MAFNGYVPLIAHTPQKAFELLDNFQFDLITLAMQFGNISGNDVMRQLLKRRIQVPVVVITVAPDEVDQTLPFAAVIQKPFQLEQLLAIVKQVLG